jgi:hypothetical protein
MVSLSCIQHIFQILSLIPIIGWGYGPVCLTHAIYPVIAAQYVHHTILQISVSQPGDREHLDLVKNNKTLIYKM